MIDIADAIAWLEAWRDKRLESIDGCVTAAQRARDYSDEITAHLLTREAAMRSADGWDRMADRQRNDVAMINRLLEALK